jgi:glutathione S-transferase
MHYTLPAIIHKASVTSNPHGALHDSFPIALHLDKAFPAPEYPSIFPNGQASIALAAATEKLLTASVAKFVLMLFAGVHGILDDRGKQYFSDTRLPRFQTKFPVESMEGLRPESQAERDTIVADTNKELQIFSTLLEGQGQNPGPFLEGEKPAYADFVLAAYLAWYERSNPEVFEALLESSNGLLKKHWEASQPYLTGQGETKEWAVTAPKI